MGSTSVFSLRLTGGDHHSIQSLKLDVQSGIRVSGVTNNLER